MASSWDSVGAGKYIDISRKPSVCNPQTPYRRIVYKAVPMHQPEQQRRPFFDDGTVMAFERPFFSSNYVYLCGQCPTHLIRLQKTRTTPQKTPVGNKSRLQQQLLPNLCRGRRWQQASQRKQVRRKRVHTLHQENGGSTMRKALRR